MKTNLRHIFRLFLRKEEDGRASGLLHREEDGTWTWFAGLDDLLFTLQEAVLAAEPHEATEKGLQGDAFTVPEGRKHGLELNEAESSVIASHIDKDDFRTYRLEVSDAAYGSLQGKIRFQTENTSVEKRFVSELELLNVLCVL